MKTYVHDKICDEILKILNETFRVGHFSKSHNATSMNEILNFKSIAYYLKSNNSRILFFSQKSIRHEKNLSRSYTAYCITSLIKKKGNDSWL